MVKRVNDLCDLKEKDKTSCLYKDQFYKLLQVWFNGEIPVNATGIRINMMTNGKLHEFVLAFDPKDFKKDEKIKSKKSIFTSADIDFLKALNISISKNKKN